MIEVVIRGDHFPGTEFTDALVVDVDELRTVRDCGIQYPAFFSNGALKTATAIDAATRGYYRYGESIPAGVLSLLGLFQVVQANFNIICAEDIL